MHRFYYSNKDAWISELSSSQNYGHDEILELSKAFKTTSTSSIVSGVTRILTQFDLSDLSASIVSGDIPSVEDDTTKYFLRLYSSTSSELQTEYNLSAFAISQSWEEGSGRISDNPIVQNGITWERRDQSDANSAWDDELGTLETGSRIFNSGSETGDYGLRGGGAWFSGSGFECTQSFSYQSPDVEMDVTTIVNKWLKQDIENNGFILTRSGSVSGSGDPQGEESDTSRQSLKFFSRNTNTIYSPKLEVRWDDRFPIKGEITGSYTALDMTGGTDNIVYVKGIRPSYRETETVKFRVGSRKRHVARTYSTSMQTLTGSFISDTSGSYSIQDLSTGETIIPFGDYSMLSIDSSSMYFNQDMNTFQPNRFYKILVKVKYNDGQEVIFDNDNFTFKVVR